MNSIDKRYFKRYFKTADVHLKHKNKSFTAKAVDYSLTGLGAVVEDGAHLGEGDVIAIDIKDPEIKTYGEVVWSSNGRSRTRIGITNIGRLKGLLQDFNLADTIIGLQRSKKTGILKIECGDILKKVYIQNGDLIFSASNQKDDWLGDLLLREGKISADQYDHSVSEMAKTKQRQGTVLVKLGYLKPHELPVVVKHQVEEIILDLFIIEYGKFVFEEVPLPTEEVITLKLSAANLIYNGTKRIGNLNRIIRRLPPLDSVVHFSPDPFDLFQDIELDEPAKKVLSCVDGKTSIKEIASITQMDTFELLRTVYGLLNTRMVEIRTESTPRTEIPEEIVDEIIIEKATPTNKYPFISEIEDMHKKYESLGYYGVLGVGPYTVTAEIKSAYYKAAKKFHPDMHFHVADDDLKDKLSDIFSYVYEAYATLSNPKKRKEYDQSLKVKPAKLVSKSDKARELFEEGKSYLKKDNYADAELLFGQAIYYDTTAPEYHYYYGVALLRRNKLFHAEKAINKALKLNPDNANYLAELGFVYLALKFPSRAKTSFRKALAIAPGHVRASEGISRSG